MENWNFKPFTGQVRSSQSTANATNHSEVKFNSHCIKTWKIKGFKITEKQDKENSNFWHRVGNVEILENQISTN